MKTIKLNNNQAELVLKAISAFIREEQREQMTAEKMGYNVTSYEVRIEELISLKQCINNQIN